MNAQFTQHNLIFKQASGTSRGVLTTKETYLLEISENNKKGIGECAIFRGLSYDDVPDYEEKLTWLSFCSLFFYLLFYGFLPLLTF